MPVVNLAEVAAYNKQLLDRYPFLWPSIDGKRIPLSEFRYMTTVMDNMPRGYAAAFGDRFVDGVDACIHRSGGSSEFLITGFSFGSGIMRVHCNMEISGMQNVFDEFEYMSERICSMCGKEAVYLGGTFEGAARGHGQLPFCWECVSNIRCEQSSRGMARAQFSELHLPEWRRMTGDVHETFNGKSWILVDEVEKAVDTSASDMVD